MLLTNKLKQTARLKQKIKIKIKIKIKGKETFRLDTSNKSSSCLIFYCSPESNLSQINKNVISSIKIQRSRPEKTLIKSNWLIHYF